MSKANCVLKCSFVQTTFKRPGAKTRRRACGGALISVNLEIQFKHFCLCDQKQFIFIFYIHQDRFILTARHCVSWDHNGVVVDGRRVQVWLGSHGREGQDGISIPVKRIIIRPDYQQPQCARCAQLSCSALTKHLIAAACGARTGRPGVTPPSLMTSRCWSC